MSPIGGRVFVSLDVRFAHAGQVLDHVFGGFAGEKSGHGNQCHEHKNEQAGAFYLLVPAPEPIEQERGPERNADDGNVIENDVEMCGIHAPNQASGREGESQETLCAIGGLIGNGTVTCGLTGSGLRYLQEKK